MRQNSVFDNTHITTCQWLSEGIFIVEIKKPVLILSDQKKESKQFLQDTPFPWAYN